MPAPYGLGYGMGAIGAGLAQGQLAATMMKPGLQHQGLQNQLLEQQLKDREGLGLAAQEAWDVDPETGEKVFNRQKFLAKVAEKSPSNFMGGLQAFSQQDYKKAQGEKAGAQTEQIKGKTEALHRDKAVQKMQFFQAIPQGQGKAFVELVAPELIPVLGEDYDYDDPKNRADILRSTMTHKDRLAAEAKEKEVALKQQGLEQKKLLDQSLIDYRKAMETYRKLAGPGGSGKTAMEKNTAAWIRATIAADPSRDPKAVAEEAWNIFRPGGGGEGGRANKALLDAGLRQLKRLDGLYYGKENLKPGQPGYADYEAAESMIQEGREGLRSKKARPGQPTPPKANVETTVNPANGKTYYKHPDGKFYLAPPQ